MEIIKALKNDDGDKAFDLILEGKFNPLEIDPKNGYTILHHAVEFGDPDIVTAIVGIQDESKQVDINQVDEEEQV